MPLINKYPTVQMVFDRKNQSSHITPGVIEIRISYQRQRKYISTGIPVLPSEWDPADQKIVNRQDANSLNARIESALRPINDYISILMLKGEKFSFEEMNAELFPKKEIGSFIDFVTERIEDRKDIREITRRNHRRLIGALKSFGRIVTFEDVTPHRIRDFDRWLHTQNYVQTTVAAYHKFLKCYIHEAMALELIATDPYIGIRIEKGKHKQRKYLTDEELKRVRDFQPSDPSTARARDLFLFQCFTGLAYADLVAFDFGQIRQQNGKYFLRDTRHKSGEDFFIVLLSPAVEILKKYNFKLPVISNQKYNSALKAVGAGAHLPFGITTHVGRHTFATYCLNHGVRIETLAEMMGHTNIKTTQIYARMTANSVQNAFATLERSLV